mgnify:CR=1 FL=1
MERDYLPICMEDMKKRGWIQADFVFVIGDAYVDHSSFGPAIISRLLERYGYKVCMIAQPDWKNDKSIDVFGRPRLGFLVCGGNMDSMVNHYSVSKKRRQKDSFSPGGEMGLRPDYATTVYCNLIRRTYKDVPIIIGGIEASLRRMAHYDYWSDKLKHSILVDSSADILSYGMGEHSMIEIAEALDSGIDVKDITFVRGTCYRTKDISGVPEDSIILPDYDSLSKDRLEYARSFYTQYCNTDPFAGKRLVEPYNDHLYVVQNPPALPLSEGEMDDVYGLPYMRTYHPSYEKDGGVPAISEVKFSLISNRGCFGGCSFCALTFHQGRIMQVRSHESLLDEAKMITQEKDFKGYIHDVGGPTANFRQPSCEKQLTRGVCKNRQCLFPKPCPNLKVDHRDYIKLLKELRDIPKVKKVFIRSGIRFDYVVADKSDAFLEELCRYHVSGQLKVAPEHVSDDVLTLMGKPENSVYQEFVKKYNKMNQKIHKDQYLVPYLMSSHPGSRMKDAVELAEHIRDLGYMPEQVQDFYPTPSTISTCMYYTGVDPRTMQPVYVPKNPHEKAMQRALIQYRDPKNYDLVMEALKKAHRMDLVGFDKHCLIRPRKFEGRSQQKVPGQKTQNQKSSGKPGRNDRGKNKNEHSRRNTVQSDRQNSRQNTGTDRSRQKKKSIRNVHKKK